MVAGSWTQASFIDFQRIIKQATGTPALIEDKRVDNGALLATSSIQPMPVAYKDRPYFRGWEDLQFGPETHTFLQCCKFDGLVDYPAFQDGTLTVWVYKDVGLVKMKFISKDGKVRVIDAIDSWSLN